MSQVSLGRPEFVPGTPPGHPTAKFLYVTFLYRFFSLHNHMTFLSLKNKYFWHHVISGQICSSKLQRVFTLGDGCWNTPVGLKE